MEGCRSIYYMYLINSKKPIDDGHPEIFRFNFSEIFFFSIMSYDALEQCFSTFRSPSPGLWQIIALLSRAKKILVFYALEFFSKIQRIYSYVLIFYLLYLFNNV